MKITLLGLEFALENLGCEALAYSFVYELNKISQDLKVDLEYTAVLFKTSPDIRVPGSEKKVDCLKIRYKSLTFWRELIKLFKESDFIFDFTGGDSFSDIYGKKRFYMGTLIKFLAIRSKNIFVLGPQTYGPYQRILVRKLAAKVIRKSSHVFARDNISQKFAAELSGREVSIAPDVAFALPYEEPKYEKNDQKIHIGINPSGLLWNGGYSQAKLPLKVDYQKYCYDLLNALTVDQRYEIHLISHVGTKNKEGVENDYSVCCMLHEKFPQTHLVEVFDTPMDAKTYISGMDVLIGARMHATIAAFSSGVATVPFSYSRKFEGLYNSINYDYIIHACSETTKDAVSKSLDYIRNYQEVKQNVINSMQDILVLQEKFRNELKGIIEKLSES